MKKEQFYPLGIFLAAMSGGLVRYFLSSQLPVSPDFPWGTLLVNYLGIFCLVYLVKGYLVYRGTSKGLVLALGTGFCGGLTTFSSLLLDAVKLLDTGRYLSLIIYLLLSIGGGLLLAYVLGRKKW
ncbi:MULTISPECIES: fluoride efflux transporter CrcB [Streptococcus]|uniref:Fluoride-specific ion channel FluC n=2 Tax=Streptococcus oralis TaxID=1303 RepID=A0A1X1INK2_STROR|nr:MULTISPECIES: fluoride efflux transporter CrcB [Streptococcus]AHZ48007.1 camphor resistance protein CrcB [Streptococcus sp. VT 162]MBA1351485.1 fluoride efflux transporter CrcB [Streptococcus oralis subsp. oralis]MBK3298057.1 fluoride efflux transporter CrcB [Streptococcus oralis]MCY7074453.1 fluoride efflux transporter CrcB [Streptococcus oralis]MDO6344919.1 fluoride efflux transporter CrcB [Streptococcus oralis]